jgi:hypothetical protein
MVPLQPKGNLKTPLASVDTTDLSVSQTTDAPLKWPLVIVPLVEKTLSALGQAVNKAGKVNAMQTRLNELGTVRKPEAVMEIPSEMRRASGEKVNKLLVGFASIL